MHVRKRASKFGYVMMAALDSGLMYKFFVAPIRRSSVLAGKLLADGLRMAAQAGVILGIAAILTLFRWRVPFATGVMGALLLMLLPAAFSIPVFGPPHTRPPGQQDAH